MNILKYIREFIKETFKYQTKECPFTHPYRQSYNKLWITELRGNIY